jgi:hypothetical protein
MTYDIRDLVRSKSQLPLEVDVEGLGIVKFQPLSIREIEETERIEDMRERGQYLLWLMLSKVEPDLTLDDIKGWRLDIVDAISDAIKQRLDFRARKST